MPEQKTDLARTFLKKAACQTAIISATAAAAFSAAVIMHKNNDDFVFYTSASGMPGLTNAAISLLSDHWGSNRDTQGLRHIAALGSAQGGHIAEFDNYVRLSDPKERENIILNAVGWAASANQGEMVNHILNTYGEAATPAAAQRALSEASRSGHTDLALQTYQTYKPLDADDALFNALSNGKFYTAKALIKTAGADVMQINPVNFSYNSEIYDNVENINQTGFAEKLQFLIDHGNGPAHWEANSVMDIGTLMHNLVQHDLIANAAFLADLGFEMKHRQSALYAALKNGSEAGVKFALDQGADPRPDRLANYVKMAEQKGLPELARLMRQRIVELRREERRPQPSGPALNH